MPDITTTVDSSEATVKAVRSEIPLGVGGEAIARVPYSPSLDRLLDIGQTTLALKGTTRCIRVIELAVQGGGRAKFHCSRPCVGVAGQQLCPEHDRESFAPNQSATGPKPAVTNSSMIKLSKAELEEMGIKESPAPVAAPAPSKSRPAPTSKPIAKPKAKPKLGQDSVTVTLDLAELCEPKHLSGTLAEKITAALDQMPATTIARMKQIVAIQEGLKKWGDLDD